MTLVAIKVNEHLCRGVIATNFTHSFCGSSLIKSLGLPHRELTKPPAVATSDGTPIEFLGEAMVLLELGPWQSEGLIPLLIAFDCPADILIGEDLIKKISQKYPVKFEFYKNAVNIGGTRVSMLDPIPAEEKFISVVVMDPHSQKEVGIENWKKGNKEAMEPGGLVKRRVEVVGQGGGEGGGSAMAKMEEENVNNAAVVEEEKAANSDELESKNDASGNTVIEELGKTNDEEIGVEEVPMEMPKECGETFDELKGKIDIKKAEDGTKDEGEQQELECEEVEATEILEKKEFCN